MSIRVTLATLIWLAVSIPGPAQARPCTCDDVDDIKASIAMIKKTRQAWYGVLSDLFGRGSNSPKNPEQAVKRFQDNMGWTTVRNVGGLSPRGETIIDPEYREQHCDTVIEGVSKHESAHRWYYVSRAIVIAMSSQRHLAMIITKSEIDARNVQIGYLIRELKDLMKRCGREYTSEPPPLRIQD